MGFVKSVMCAAACMCSILFLMCGCISVTYTPADGGKKDYPALGKDDRSVIYYEASQIPGKASDRVFVGSAEAEGSTSVCTLNEIKDKLNDKARSYGANVILITEINHKEIGLVRGDQVQNLAAPGWTPVDDSASNVAAQRNMDLYLTGKDPDVPVYEITIKARFYRVAQDLLAKEPVFLRGNSKPKRRTAPAVEKNTIRVR